MNDYKKIVFVCSKLRGDYEKNIENAKKYCRHIMLTDTNAVAFAPHVYFTQFLNDDNISERKLGIEAGIELLKACDEVMVFSEDGKLSLGMEQEIEVAKEYGKPITYLDASEVKMILMENK